MELNFGLLESSRDSTSAPEASGQAIRQSEEFADMQASFASAAGFPPISHNGALAQALPNSQQLARSTVTTSDGHELTRFPVDQDRLHVLQSVGVFPERKNFWDRITGRNSIPKPEVRVVAEAAFAAMQRIEPVQQRVAELCPFRPNNLTSLLASDGEAAVRYKEAWTNANYWTFSQYGAPQADMTARSGAGVCSDVNNVLFRAIAEQETRPVVHTMRDRAAGVTTMPSRLPVTFALNQGPHAFVMLGDLLDPRQANDVVLADSWEALSIVKTWQNTNYAALPYTTRMQATSGSSFYQDRSLSDFSTLAGQRTAPTREATESRPLAALLEPSSQHTVYNVLSTAQNPRVIYENAFSGERFSPSIGINDYQQVRAAVAHPLFRQGDAISRAMLEFG